MELPDIRTDEDLEKVIRSFYAKAMQDPLIGTYFTGIHQLDLEAHLPRMLAFWKNGLFHTGGYDGNMIAVHQKFHDMAPFQGEHYQRWLDLFDEAIQESYIGPVAEQARRSAFIIATVLKGRLS